jgi:hypothetical protein
MRPGMEVGDDLSPQVAGLAKDKTTLYPLGR